MSTPSPAIFERTFRAGWADMDFNGHMRNTAYLDRVSDTRMLYFHSSGFTAAEFARIGFGPVLKTDRLEYFREVRLMDEMRITLQCAGMSEDGRKWRLRNEIYRMDGTLSVRVTSDGGWLNLAERKLMPPPPALFDCMQALTRTPDFELLP